jgi:hypothetical protein
MSASLAAARKRRGVIEQAPAPIPQPPQSNQVAGLTLQQVIALVDKRLITLETFMKDQTTSSRVSFSPKDNNIQSLSNDVIKAEVENMAEEFNSRYELLATEINSIKDIVLKLQTYTMDVNKMLMEERVHILSDVGNPNITIEEDDFE